MTADSEPSPPGDAGPNPPSRRGWQLPTPPPGGGGTTSEPLGDEPSRRQEIGEPPNGAALSLRGAVFGQVTEVSEGAIQGSQSNEPVVTLRLERYDPHVGRTAILV